MKIHLIRNLVMILALVSGTARADWPVFDRDIQQDVIPLDGTDTAAEVVRLDMGSTAGVSQPGRPDRGVVPELATKDGGYVLCGDLFGTGRFYVLYEPKIGNKPGLPTMALAEYGNENDWVLRGLWKIPISWVSKKDRWSGTSQSTYPKETRHKPFVLEDVVGDGTPEVIVAGEQLKFHRVSYLLKFDEKTHGLTLLCHAMAKPVKVGKYVRTFETSGNKATWAEWTFQEWKDDKLAERATWHSESPYNNVDPPYYLVTSTAEDGTREEFRVNFGNYEKETPWKYEILKDGKPFATMMVKWIEGKSRENEHLMEGAWIFEKLTGLSREFFPERYGPETEEKPKLERLEDYATVEMKVADGNVKALRRFSESK
jgi:hypothetical protein